MGLFDIFKQNKKKKEFSESDITNEQFEFLKFINKKEINNHTKNIWSNILNENTADVIEKFISINYLKKADGVEKLHLISNSNIKQILDFRNLIPIDNKEFNLDLIKSNFTNEEIENMTKLYNICILTEKGNDKLNEYLISKNNKKIIIEKKALLYLKESNVVEASKIISNYEKEQLFPRYSGFDWNEGFPINFIKTVENILNLNYFHLENTDDFVENFKCILSLSYLLGETVEKIEIRINNSIEKYSCKNIPLNIYIHSKLNEAINIVKLEELKNTKEISKIKISSLNNKKCEYCKNLTKIYPKENFNEIPHLPSDFGCTCTYEGVYEV